MKIEKLKPNDRGDGFLTPATPNDMYWKINEIIDAVNVIAADIDGIKKRLPPMFTVDTKKTNQISEIIERETRNKMIERQRHMIDHFNRAIMLIKAIAGGEESPTVHEMRKDPRCEGRCWMSVRMMANIAIEELTIALQDEQFKPMEEQI